MTKDFHLVAKDFYLVTKRLFFFGLLIANLCPIKNEKMSKKPFHYELKNEASGEAEILLYGFIGKWEEFDYPRFQNVFRAALQNNKNLTIRVHCGGGSVFEGLAIYDLIRSSDSHVKVYVEGMAASMGGIIALAGDEIVINENAFFMMHAVSGGTWGNKQDLLNYLDTLNSCEDRLRKIFIERTNATTETIEEWLTSGKDFWLTSDVCKELGIVDEIVKPTKKRKSSDNEAKNIMNKTAEEAFEMFNISYAPEPENNTNNLNLNTDMKKEAILAVLMTAGMVGTLSASSSDNDFENHLKDILNKAKKADSMENELKEFKQTQAKTLIASALQSGKITAAEKDEWEKDAIENYALVSKSLDRMAGKPDPNAGLKRDPKTPANEQHELLKGRENWTFSEWQAKDPAGLERLKDEAANVFEELFNKEYN